ncbi:MULTISPECIES: hypothetical protein [Actinoalloteichus]|uniref:Uncharacterized protein n=1 Tax=Actinoalloteichus fjordicus TaxID=1612552 RepID=A0AAC9L7P2_9PSEU|nr:MULTISPECIES: hypothetical protein [Actinoalloteichus]APU12421.1 hypothetical protein UA74_01665 [Actinoalloteichus fjordicus]APU18374.1 hypothetical protein UA75_01670 [Actinoalloteichus sp. GBA129-24]
MRRVEQTVRNGLGAGRPSRGRLIPAALAAGLALVVSGCSAGQITQTSRKEPVINGINGDVGDMAVRDAQLLFPVGEDHFYPAGSSIPLSMTLVNTGRTTDRLVEITSPSAALVEVEGDTEIPGGTTVVATVDPADWTDAQRRLAEQEEQGSTSPSTVEVDPENGDVEGDAAGTEGDDAAGDDAAGADTEGDDATDDATSTSTPSSQANAQNRLPLEDDVITVTLTDLINDLQPGINLEIVFVFENAGPISLQVPMGAPSEPRANTQDDQH